MTDAPTPIQRSARSTPAEARASAPLDVREALHESLAAMVSVSEPGINEFARGLKQARLQHAIRVAREALGLTTTDEGAEPACTRARHDEHCADLHWESGR